PQGEPCWGEKPSQRTPRGSLIDTLHGHPLLAPFVFEGYCDTALFETSVEHCLVPALKPGQRVISDNASFQQSAKARQLMEGGGCTQKFLPLYSPALNPIEHSWFPRKPRMRKYLSCSERDLHKTIEAVLSQPQAP